MGWLVGWLVGGPADVVVTAMVPLDPSFFRLSKWPP